MAMYRADQRAYRSIEKTWELEDIDGIIGDVIGIWRIECKKDSEL
jgi:hypothetical protein